MSDMLISLEDWPNCAIPDCEYKACLALGSNLCYHHTRGDVPPDPAVYFERAEEPKPE